jgi:dihydrofolate reductase
MATRKKFNVIVAACANGGIGIDGGIPWTLKGDMKQFARLTTETRDSTKQNAVVMGSKTWKSIPLKHRPLKNRMNVVISQTLSGLLPPVYQVHSMEQAMELVSSPPWVDQVETVWIIGGQSLYQHAMQSPCLDRVYFTNVLREFQCDTFFPVEELRKMKLIADDRLPLDQQEENGIPFCFEVYSAVPKC